MEKQGNERNLTLQEKLDIIDHEIRLLHQFCKQTGYSPQKIEEFAEPFIKVKKAKRKASNSRLSLYISIIFAIFTCLLLFGIVLHPLGKTLIRLTIVKFYPLYKHIPLNKDECLIRNPLYHDQDQLISEEDCQLCDGINGIERVSDISIEQFVEDYMKTGGHVIVTDGMKDWPDTLKSLTIERLIKEYQKNPGFYDNISCDITNNLQTKSIQDLLQMADKRSGYFISWINCVKNAAKAMRRFYKRPYFLPPSVEMFEQNFLFLSKQYKGDDLSEFKTETAVIILIQIKGSSRIYLHPEEFCNKTCNRVEDILHEGEILVAMNTNKVWTLEIQGTDQEESISIGVEGNYS